MFFFVVIIRLNKITRKYRQLLIGSDGKNLEQTMLSNGRLLEQILLKLELVDDRLKNVEGITAKSIQHVGLVRFNAFKDMGGELSYALALLDQKGDGVVISSIFSRDDARTYAKPIKAGKSSYQLSVEEEEAIQQVAKVLRV